MERKKDFGSWRNKILPALMIIAFFVFSAQSCEQVEKKDIKSSSYWTNPIMNVEQAKKLAEHEVVIVDMENMINNKASLKLLKGLNPNIKLLAYTNPMEFFLPMPADRPIQRKWFQQVQAYPNWFLKTGDGSQAIFWPKMVMMNLSSACPKYEIDIMGKKFMMTYTDWIAHKTLTEVLSDPIWDGYFMDNSGGSISWVYQNKSYQLDIDNDGLADSSFKIDNAWSDGIHNFLTAIRTRNAQDFIMVGNKGSVEFIGLVNGKFFEPWPSDNLGSKQNDGWNQCMENAMQMEALGAKYIFFQVTNPGYLEFAIASALLLDNVYVVVGQDNDKMYPILKAKIGKPLGPFMQSDFIYYRDYENGSVEVRPKEKWSKIRIFDTPYLSEK